MSVFSETGLSDSPYPGLRPFRRDEADIFFGREEQVDEALAKLESCRMLTLVGSSGCGKSSLVRAGMLSALNSGFMAGAGTSWQVAEMRPGNQPLANLAASLLESDVLPSEWSERPDATGFLQATLRRGPLGLVELLKEIEREKAAQRSELESTPNFVLLVDQFEEIFRFHELGDANEATAFVNLLLATASQTDMPAYIVLTMRSDFLGDCSIFDGLPEMINTGQFLIPRMNREQCRAAILGPAAAFDVEVEPSLINRVLNDMGTDPDQLPLMQHALMRVWSEAVESSSDEPVALTSARYEAAGGLHEALSNHADELYDTLSIDDRRIAEVMFRCLTERSGEQRDTRRPASLSAIAAVAQATTAKLKQVVDLFRQPQCSFLTPAIGVELSDDTVLDIGHESLIRQWARMSQWVRSEALSAGIYRRLAETARLWKTGHAAVWTTPDLENALAWRETERPNAAWSERYGGGFESSMEFLEASIAEREKSERAEEERQHRELELLQEVAETEKRRADDAEIQRREQVAAHGRLRRWTFVAMCTGLAAGALAVVAFVMFAAVRDERDRADQERSLAKDAQTRAETSALDASHSAQNEKLARTKADRLAKQADKDRKKAVALAKLASTAQSLAVTQTLSAYQSLARANLAQADSLWDAKVLGRRKRALILLRGTSRLRGNAQALMPKLAGDSKQIRQNNTAIWDMLLPRMRTQAVRWLSRSSLQAVRTFEVPNTFSGISQLNATGTRLAVFTTNRRSRSQAGSLKLFDPRSGQLLHELSISMAPGTRSQIIAMAFSADNKHLVVAVAEGKLSVTPSIKLKLQYHRLTKLDVAKSVLIEHTFRAQMMGGGRSARFSFSRSGQTLVHSDRLTTRLWDTTSGKTIRSHKGGYFLGLAGDAQLLSTSDGKVLSVFDIKTGKNVHQIPVATQQIKSATASSDGKWIIVELPLQYVSSERWLPIQIFNGKTGKTVAKVLLPKRRTSFASLGRGVQIGFHPRAEIIVAATGGSINLVSVKSGELLVSNEIKPRANSVNSSNTSWRLEPRLAQFNANGSQCITISAQRYGGRTDIVQFWDPSVAAVQSRPFRFTKGIQQAASVGSQGIVVASGTNIRLSTTVAGGDWETAPASRQTGFSPNGKNYVQVWTDETGVWNSDSGKLATRISTRPSNRGRAYLPSFDRHWIIGRNPQNSCISVFDADNAKWHMPLADADASVTSVEFDPHSKYAGVYVAGTQTSSDSYLRMIRLADRQEVLKIKGSFNERRITEQNLLAIRYDNGKPTLLAYELKSGKLLSKFVVPGSQPVSLHYQFDVFSFGAVFWRREDNVEKVYVWRFAAGKDPVTLPQSYGSVRQVLQLDDKRFLLSTRSAARSSPLQSRGFEIWDLESVKKTKELKFEQPMDRVHLLAKHQVLMLSTGFRRSARRKATTIFFDLKTMKQLASYPVSVGNVGLNERFLFFFNGQYIDVRDIRKTPAPKLKAINSDNLVLSRTRGPLFSKDGKLIVVQRAIGKRQYSEIVDLQSTKAKVRLLGRILAFLPNSEVAVFVVSGRINIHDLNSGKLKHSIDVRHENAQKGAALSDRASFAISSDQRTVAAIVSGQVRLAKLSSKKVHAWLPRSGHADAVLDVDTSPDGKLIASGSRDRSIGFWHADSGKYAGLIEGLPTAIQQVTFGPKGKRLLARDQNGAVTMWQLSVDNRVVRARRLWSIGSLRATTAVISRNGKWVAAAQNMGDVIVLDPADGSVVSILRSLARIRSSLTQAIQFHPSRNELAVASGDGGVAVWDLAKKKMRAEWTTGQGAIHAMTYSRDGELLLTAAADIRVWDTEKGKRLVSLSHHTQDVRGLEFDSSGAKLLSFSDDRTAVWIDFKHLTSQLDNLDMGLALRSNSPVLVRIMAMRNQKRWKIASRTVVEQAQAQLTLFPLAIRAEQDRRWKIAAQHLSKLVKGRPSNAALVSRLAWARASEGNWTEAIKEYRRAIALVENDLNAYYFLAIAQLAADDMTGYQKTRSEILKRWVKPRRRAAAARVVYASIYGKDATPKEEELLLTLAKRAGQSRLLAAIYVRTKKYDKAIELLKRELSPWDRMVLTLAYIRSNKRKEAQQTFKEVQAVLKTKKNTDWVAWHERAEVYAMVREAAKLLKR